MVVPAEVSPSTREKARRKRMANGFPPHSFRSLLENLATLTKNRVAPRLPGAEPFEMLAQPTDVQSEVFRLLGVRLKCTQ